jgi:two-component system NarL family sensor kinase
MRVVPFLDAKVFELGLSVLTESGLTATLAQECGAFIRRTGIPCAGQFEPLDVDAERSALLVLIAREALSNIARHSGATNVEVMLQGAGQRGLLTVRDNGCGLDLSRLKQDCQYRVTWDTRAGPGVEG